MSGIDSHIGLSNIAVSRYVDLKSRSRAERYVGADAEDLMKVRRIRRSDRDRNHYRAIDLTAGKFEPGSQRDRCYPAHTSKTHRHPEKKFQFE